MVVAFARRDTTAPTTVDSTTFTSASFTPTADDLLAVCIRVTGTVGSNPVLAASANGITFTRLVNQFTNASAHKDIIFIANQKVPASPVAMTVTVTLTSGDTATGCHLAVIGVSGMARVGTDAVRNYSTTPQIAAVDNNPSTGGVPPSAVLPVAPLTTNPLIGLNGSIAVTTYTGPTGWATYYSNNHATPTSGMHVFARASGETRQTIPMVSSTTVGGWAVIELDASVPVTATAPPPDDRYRRLLPLLIR